MTALPEKGQPVREAGFELPASVPPAAASPAWRPEEDCRLNHCSLLPPPFRFFYNFLNPLNRLNTGLGLRGLCQLPDLTLLSLKNLRLRPGQPLIPPLVRGQGNPEITASPYEENRAEVCRVIGKGIGISKAQALHTLRNVGQSMEPEPLAGQFDLLTGKGQRMEFFCRNI